MKPPRNLKGIMFAIMTFLVAASPISAYADSISSGSSQTSQTNSSPKELTSLETEYSRVFLNPDGTISSKIYFAPVNYMGQDGNLHHIDTTITPDQNGGYQVDQNRFTTQFGGAANSSNLESVTYKGKQVSFQLAPQSVTDAIGTQVFSDPGNATLSTNSSKITYGNVYPDVSLQEEVTSLGVKESIVLNKYQPGLNTFAFVLNTNGVTPKLAQDGSVDFVDSSGKTVFYMPPGMMQDSNVDPHSGDPQQSNAVTYNLETIGGKTVLVVSVDEKWLADPSRVYPVYIDPTIQTQISDAYVSSAYPTTTYTGSSLWDSALNEYDLHVGYYDSTTGTNWAYFKLPPANQLPLLGLTVSSASFNAYCNWSYYTSTAEPTYLWANTSANWSTGTINWDSTPTYASPSIASRSFHK